MELNNNKHLARVVCLCSGALFEELNKNVSDKYNYLIETGEAPYVVLFYGEYERLYQNVKFEKLVNSLDVEEDEHTPQLAVEYAEKTKRCWLTIIMPGRMG